MSYPFSYLFAWLLVLWVFQLLAIRLTRLSNTPGFSNGQDASFSSQSISPSTWRNLLGFAVAALVIVVVPVRGIPLGRWLAGLNLHPSIPLLGLLASAIWKKAFQTDIFRPIDQTAAWIFGSLAGTVLYPLALGLGNFDPYSWGWSLSALFPIIAVTTVVLIWKGNRFGILLLLSILAYDLHVSESPNYWDYIVDPLYWLLSLLLLGKAALIKLRRDKPRALTNI